MSSRLGVTAFIILSTIFISSCDGQLSDWIEVRDSVDLPSTATTSTTTSSTTTTTPPDFSATITKEGAQADTTTVLPLEFEIVFSNKIDPGTLDTSDISNQGSGTGVTWNISNIGDDKNFTLQVTSGGYGSYEPQINFGLVTDIYSQILELNSTYIGNPVNYVFDPDGDGVYGANDNCPYTSNVAQTDTNSDGKGDACSTDVSASFQLLANNRTTGLPPCAVGAIESDLFDLEVRNNSASTLTDLWLEVHTLWQSNVNCDADGGPAPAPTIQTVDLVDDYSDGALGPGETMHIMSNIGIMNVGLYQFYFNIRGVSTP
jgi:hypothetical protein